MVSLKILIVHGIGNTRAGYSDGMQKGLRREFNRQLDGFIGVSEDRSDQLEFFEVVWDEVLAQNEGKLKAIFEAELSRKRLRGTKTLLKDAFLIIVAFLVFGFVFENPFVLLLLLISILALFSQLLYKLRTAFAAESVCDIVAYRNRVNYTQIHNRLEQGVLHLGRGVPSCPVTFISHSLGTVIASDYVYDTQEGLNNRKKDFRCANFFTLGSPLALFSLEYGPQGFSKPIAMEDEWGRWVNIFDADDPIAYKLKNLNDAYDRAVLRDDEVNTGFFGFSHLKYWENKSVLRLIARKLALDWLTANRMLDEQELRRLHREYDDGGRQV